MSYGSFCHALILCSWGIFVEGSRAGRQLYPWMSTAVVDGNPGCGKSRIGESTYRDADGFVIAIFGVEDRRPANGAEPESELRSLIADSNVLRGGAEDIERSGESGQRREDAAGPLLTGEAIAHADPSGVPLNLNAQLPAGTRGCSGRHRSPRRVLHCLSFISTLLRNVTACSRAATGESSLVTDM